MSNQENIRKTNPLTPSKDTSMNKLQRYSQDIRSSMRKDSNANAPQSMPNIPLLFPNSSNNLLDEAPFLGMSNDMAQQQ